MPLKYRLSEKKYRSPVIMIVPALGLSIITHVKEMRKVTESPRTWPNQSLRTGVSQWVHSIDFGWAIFMKGHVTMGFFSRLMGGSDKQTTAASEFEILAPVSGELVNLEKTNDPAFSSRAVGDGVAVVPQEGTVCAPVSGTVAALFPTEHALGIMSDNSSAQVMLHIGIDTVKLEGKGFHALVAQGDHVDAGQPLVEVDFDVVRAAGFDPTVFVIVCERSENSTLREHASGPVAVKEPVVWLSE